MTDKITPCLWFDDNAEEAANFYVSLVPNSKIDRVQRNVTDSPSGKVGSVLVVLFTLGGRNFVALNGGTKLEYNNAASLMLDCADQAEVDRLWDKLSDGGQPLACGWIKDRYGVPWQVVPRVMLEMLADPDTAKAARAMAAMMTMVKLDIAALKAAYDGAPA